MPLYLVIPENPLGLVPEVFPHVDMMVAPTDQGFTMGDPAMLEDGNIENVVTGHAVSVHDTRLNLLKVCGECREQGVVPGVGRHASFYGCHRHTFRRIQTRQAPAHSQPSELGINGVVVLACTLSKFAAARAAVFSTKQSNNSTALVHVIDKVLVTSGKPS